MHVLPSQQPVGQLGQPPAQIRVFLSQVPPAEAQSTHFRLPWPQALSPVPATQSLPKQQPLGQLGQGSSQVRCEVQALPSTRQSVQAKPPCPQAPSALPGTQTGPSQQPAGQFWQVVHWAVVGSQSVPWAAQSTQAAPPAPQAASVVPGWQVPVALSQQPEAQSAQPPQVWLSGSQVLPSDEQSRQTPPPVPQAVFVLPG